MFNNFIRRTDVIPALIKYGIIHDEWELQAVARAISVIETENIVSVSVGWWEIVPGAATPGGDPWLICPFCRDKDSEHLGGIEAPRRWNWCPVCGAKLDERGVVAEQD